jgi:hypothetical protein
MAVDVFEKVTRLTQPLSWNQRYDGGSIGIGIEQLRVGEERRS